MKTFKQYIAEGEQHPKPPMMPGDHSYMGDYKKKKVGTKDTVAKSGQPVYDIFYNYEDGKLTKIGTVSPYSSYSEKKKPGARIVTSRKNIVAWQLDLHGDEFKKAAGQLPIYTRMKHRSAKSAIEALAHEHESFLHQRSKK